AGAVERGGLENRCPSNRTEGSNPSLSANKKMPNHGFCERPLKATGFHKDSNKRRPERSEAAFFVMASPIGDRDEQSPPLHCLRFPSTISASITPFCLRFSAKWLLMREFPFPCNITAQNEPKTLGSF